MSIRLDPRRLAALKLLAAEAGVRPGEMVTQWVEERLDAARRGEAAAAPATDGKAIAALSARIDELARRLDALSPQGAPAAVETAPTEAADSCRPRPEASRPTAQVRVRRDGARLGTQAPVEGGIPERRAFRCTKRSSRSSTSKAP